jgi:protein-tyrosine phosphatase
VSSLPKDTWIHIHCRGGEGRTTTFLAILEMLHFKNHSLYDILTRQYHVGGKDLLKMPEEVDRQQAARDRLDVIRRTYDDLH